MLNISTSPDFFFACELMFQKRKQYYMQYYDTMPSFKAGVHLGKVTAVEIGEIKRDIAYHGDTLNTAARILSLCNTYQKNILISEAVLEYVSSNHLYRIERLGKITLRGKMQEVEIAGIERA
jgi:adenylate cyclase